MLLQVRCQYIFLNSRGLNVIRMCVLPRVAEVGNLSARAKMAIQTFVKRVFTFFATNASFLCVIANLTQYNMEYIPPNSASLVQETLFLTQKSA